MSVAREYVFDGLKKDGWEPISQQSSVRLYENEHSVPHILKLPVHEFCSDQKVVFSNKPVQITITTEDKIYFAENESLSIYANGDSLESVIEEFSHHLVHFFEYYESKNEDEVTGKAVRLKNLYENHFQLK